MRSSISSRSNSKTNHRTVAADTAETAIVAEVAAVVVVVVDGVADGAAVPPEFNRVGSVQHMDENTTFCMAEKKCKNEIPYRDRLSG